MTPDEELKVAVEQRDLALKYRAAVPKEAVAFMAALAAGAPLVIVHGSGRMVPTPPLDPDAPPDEPLIRYTPPTGT